MTRCAFKRAFTLIELLVVVAIISLLMAILMPSLTRARQQAKAAVCLANLNQIGILLHAYSNEDVSAQIIPIHPMMIRLTGNPWIATIGHSFVWGGRDAQHPLPSDSGAIWLSGGGNGYVPPSMPGPTYGADLRPLNRYYLGTGITDRERKEMPVFRCPADAGYSASAGEVPPAAAGVPCYELFGNSYRAQTTTSFIDDCCSISGAFSWGVWGHRLHTIPTPDRIVLIAEPPFYAAGSPNDPDWHGRGQSMNVLFVDGSSRPTSTQANPLPDAAALIAMDLPVPPVPCNALLLSQGPRWRMDVWPTPGARIWGPNPLWSHDEQAPFSSRTIHVCLDRAKWPFVNYEQNLE